MDALPRDDARSYSVPLAIRRHLIWVIVVTLVVAALAAFYAHSTAKTYTASATVLPQPSIGNPLSPDTVTSSGTQLTVALQTEAGLADTSAVSAMASTALHRQVPGPHDSVAVTVPANTQLIRISYTSPTAAGARDGAQAFATAYLATRQQRAVAVQSATLSSLQQQAKATARSLTTASRASVLNPGASSTAAQLVRLYSTRLTSISDAMSTAQSSGTAPGKVVTAATLPTTASGLGATTIIVVGIIVGLVLGLLLALWLEWRSDLVHSSTENDIGGTPFLAKLPREANRPPPLISDREPDDILHEAYRRLRAGVVATTEPPRVLSISPVSAEDSSTGVAVNLAIALSQAGFGVTVVAGDPGDRGVEELLNRSASPGLADVITQQAKLDDCVQAVAGIGLVGGGSQPENARELYAGPRLKETFATLKTRADFVIVSTAATSSADADAVTTACDGVLIVVGDGHTTHAQAATALDRFSRLEVVCIGAVSVPRSRRDDRRRAPSSVVSTPPDTPAQPTEKPATETGARQPEAAANVLGRLRGRD